MRSSTTHKRGLLAAVVVVGASLLSATPAAAAAGTLWAVQSAAVPTIMHTSDSVSAVQQIKIAATGGTFTLSLEGQTTVPIAYDATPASVEAALNALSSIAGNGGSVSVTGGPGDELGSSPYIVTFGGTLRGVPEEKCLFGTFGCEPNLTAESALLSGGAHTATITQSTVGSTNDENH
jgi:hypothetical protein